ncbi:soluble NSF attachment protein receptor [Tribonema minus]|uniref:Soluble NSF attachment protein receptor n=1 Tax=Tribonema minus TaxID=303371 RepID=A0A835ZEW5_9STRA|nr:soluble NSF attachment protein receptor [Tribonema minus]
MSSLDAQWTNDYNRLRTQQLNAAQAALDSLSNQLRAAETRPMDHGLTRVKVLRRRSQLEGLEQQLQSVGGGGGAGMRGSGSGGISGRLAKQREAMQEHDRIVEELGKGVGRLHQTSVVINDEANLHVRLLDDMDEDIERANASLMQETRHAQKANLHVRLLDDMDEDIERANASLVQETWHAQKVRQKSKTFWLYVTIIVLTIVLVLLIVSGL